MKKRFALHLVLVVLVLSLTAVGNSFAAGQKKGAGRLPATISMGTNPVGSSNNALGIAIAEVVSKYLPTKLIVRPYEGPASYFPLMERGEVELGFPAGHELAWAYRGEVIYKDLSAGKGLELRTIMLPSRFAIGMAAAGDSGIKTGRDMKGKRLALPSEVHYGARASSLAFLANFNLTLKDVKVVPVPSFTAAMRAVIEGRADMSSPSVGSAVTKELEAARGIRFISLDPSPEAMKRFHRIYPTGVKLVKAGSATGILEDIYLPTPLHVISSGKVLPEDLAYDLAKVVWDHIDELRLKHRLLKDVSREELFGMDATVPYHPGVIKFLKEKGVWNAKMENLQKELLERK